MYVSAGMKQGAGMDLPTDDSILIKVLQVTMHVTYHIVTVPLIQRAVKNGPADDATSWISHGCNQATR